VSCPECARAALAEHAARVELEHYRKTAEVLTEKNRALEQALRRAEERKKKA
jgi:hypothetical protein